MKEQLKMVEDFHYLTNNPVHHALHDAPAELRFLRAHLVTEEAAELTKALYFGDVVQASDALCDLLYVTYGTALALGLGSKLEALFAEVHRSNMTKDASPDATAQVNPTGNRVLRKGPNYRPPLLEPILYPELADNNLDAVKRVREAAEHS